MYCVKCGVELEDSEKKCPLCGTVVYHPDIAQKKQDKLYPKYDAPSETVSRSGMLFVLTVLFSLPFLLTLLCDVSINKDVTWSGYAAGAIFIAYSIIVLPLWFRKPNPVIFVPIDFAVCGAYIWFIDYATKGQWFLSFALPVIIGCTVISVSVITLCHYIRKGFLFIYGGASIVCGAFTIVIEYLLNTTFHLRDTYIWSIYPLTCLVIIGLMLIVIAICKPLRESFYKKFFL